jgi:hypothetical protein
MVLLIFLFDLFFDEKFVLLNFSTKVKHRVFNVIFQVQKFIGQRDKRLITLSHLLAGRTFSLQFLTFFQILLRSIPSDHILFQGGLTNFVIGLMGLFGFLLQSGKQANVIERRML